MRSETNLTNVFAKKACVDFGFNILKIETKTQGTSLIKQD
jgi:hypothetical protein